MFSSTDNVSLFKSLTDPSLPLQLFRFISSETFSSNQLTKIDTAPPASLEAILEIPLIKIIYLIDNKFVATPRNRKEESKAFALLIKLLEKHDTKTLIEIQASIIFLMCIKYKLIDLSSFPKAPNIVSSAHKKILKVIESYSELDNLKFLEILFLRTLEVVSLVTIRRTLSTSYTLSLFYGVYTEQSMFIPLINLFFIGFIYNKLNQKTIENLLLRKESLQNVEQLCLLLDSMLIEVNDKEAVLVSQPMDSSQLQVLENQPTSKNEEEKYFCEQGEKREIKSSIPIPNRAKFKRKQGTQKLKSAPIVRPTVKILDFLSGIIVTTFHGFVSLPHKVIKRCKKRNKEETLLSYNAPPKKKESYAYYKAIDATETDDCMMDDEKGKFIQFSNIDALSRQKRVRKKAKERETTDYNSIRSSDAEEVVENKEDIVLEDPTISSIKKENKLTPAPALQQETLLTQTVLDDMDAITAERVPAETPQLVSPILALLEALTKTFAINDPIAELWETDSHHQTVLKKSVLPAYKDAFKMLFGKKTLKAWQALEICGVLDYLLPDLHDWLKQEQIIDNWLQDTFKNLDAFAIHHALDPSTHFDEFTSILLTLEMYRVYQRTKNTAVPTEEASLLLYLSVAWQSKTAQLLGVTDLVLQPRMITQFRYLMDYVENIQSVSPQMEEHSPSPELSFRPHFSSPGFYTSMGIGDDVSSHLYLSSSHLFAYSHVHISPIPSSFEETLSQDYKEEIGDERANAARIKMLPPSSKEILPAEKIAYLQSHLFIKELQVIVNSKYKIYLAGGAVEDIFRNRLPRDFDFVTDAPANFIETHLKWRLSPYQENYFQTTLPGCSADLRAEITLKSLVEHSKTRDIASSALFIDLSDLTHILDPTGKGFKSIRLQSVTLVVETEGLKQTEKFGHWQKVFREDPIRLLRVAHICAKYNDHLPTDLHALILTQTDCISELSAGRLRNMIKKSFLQGDAVNHFNYCVALGLFKSLFPDIKKESYLWLKNQLIKQDKDFNSHHKISSFYFLALLILAEDIGRKKSLSDEEITTRSIKYAPYIAGMWPDRDNLQVVKKYAQSIEKETLCLSDTTLPLSAETNQSLKISGSQFRSWCVFLGKSKEHAVDVRDLSAISSTSSSFESCLPSA